MNPQQLAIYNATKLSAEAKEADEAWTQEIVKMRMVTEYLKCGILDIGKDLNKAFRQNYNFNMYDKDFEWVSEKPNLMSKRPID